MKITVLKKNLRDGLAIAEHAIAENNNLPALRSILIRTEGDAIQLRATNLEIAVTTIISGKVVEHGGIAIPFAPLYSIVSNLVSERIELLVVGQTLEITTDNYSAKIQGLPEGDFPIIPQLETTEQSFTIDSAVLRDALSQVVVAAQISEIRPELSGVLFDFQLTTLTLVATDSFRLAHKTLTDRQFKSACGVSWKAIFPLYTTAEIMRIFPGSSSLSCALDAHQLLIKNETTQLISRLIDGDYPDYNAVIPRAFTGELTTENNQLVQALKLVSNFSGKVNDVHFALSDDGRSLAISSANSYVGENRYLIPIKSSGERFKDLVFNWRYLLDGIRAIPATEIHFSLNGDAKPGLIKSQSDASYFYVVMPIRTQ